MASLQRCLLSVALRVYRKSGLCAYQSLLYIVSSSVRSVFILNSYWLFDSLWIKPTDALNFNFIGITTLHISAAFLPIIRSS